MTDTEVGPASRPSVQEALSAVRSNIEAESIEADRIVLRILATGEVAYRVEPSDGGDYVGGVVMVRTPA